MSRVITFAVTAIAALIVSPSTHADGCDHGVSQLAADLCALDDLQRVTASLDALYDRMMQDPAFASRSNRLQASEQAWAAYRDVECRFEDSWAEGGSMQPMLNSDCARALTARRIADLTAAFSCVHDSSPGNCRSP